ncbi:hypothetical protein SDC9_137985 [bioreactor metagenome]|uniref:Uncharacterized protein n=1 Tax=bioreactor metagenome TaxID=1076179 RepID=A0A645DQV5_9ZZZZ
MVGFWNEDNVRFREFKKRFLQLNPKGKVKYLHLGHESSSSIIYLFTQRASEEKAIFSIDYAANHIVASYLSIYNMKNDNSFIVYNCDNNGFEFPNLPVIESIAPSLITHGEKLSLKLLKKIKSGEWDLPLQEKI